MTFSNKPLEFTSAEKEQTSHILASYARLPIAGYPRLSEAEVEKR